MPEHKLTLTFGLVNAPSGFDISLIGSSTLMGRGLVRVKCMLNDQIHSHLMMPACTRGDEGQQLVLKAP